MCGWMVGTWSCSGPTGWRVRRKRRRFSGPERWFAHLEHFGETRGEPVTCLDQKGRIEPYPPVPLCAVDQHLGLLARRQPHPPFLGDQLHGTGRGVEETQQAVNNRQCTNIPSGLTSPTFATSVTYLWYGGFCGRWS